MTGNNKHDKGKFLNSATVPSQLGMDRCGATLDKSGVPVDKGCSSEGIMIGCQVLKWHSSVFPVKCCQI